MSRTNYKRETIVESFARLTHWNQFAYRGVLIQRSGTGYKVGEVWCQDKEAVDVEINKRLEVLQLSLNRIKSNHVNEEKSIPQSSGA